MAIERTFIVPVADNNGLSLDHEISEIENVLLDIVGGFSVVEQRGCWKGDDGKVYRDHSLRFSTTCSDLQDTLITALLPYWTSLTRQECLFTSSTTVAVEFISPLPTQLEVVA